MSFAAVNVFPVPVAPRRARGRQPAADTIRQRGDRRGLVSGGLVGGADPEIGHRFDSSDVPDRRCHACPSGAIGPISPNPRTYIGTQDPSIGSPWLPPPPGILI